VACAALTGSRRARALMNRSRCNRLQGRLGGMARILSGGNKSLKPSPHALLQRNIP